MKKLYKFYKYFGRMGSIESVFVANDADVARFIGKEVYFGEILGKHSEVYFDLEESQFEVLSEDERVICVIEEYVGSVGHNPIERMFEMIADGTLTEDGDRD